MPNFNQKEPYGRVAAAGGGVFALIGLTMLVSQAFTGEWMITVMINEHRQQGARPLGNELASIVLAFGLAFVFIGLGYAAWSPRRGLLLTGVGVSNLVAAAISFGVMLLGATTGTDFDWFLLIVWPFLVLAGVAVARHHPDFTHGRLIADLSAKYPVTEPDGFLYAPVHSNRPRVAAGGRRSHSLYEGYEAFARRMNGKATLGKRPLFGRAVTYSVNFTQGGVPCAIDVEKVPHGRSHRTFTRVWFELPQRGTFTCQVLPQSLGIWSWTWFGPQDVRLGWLVFDDQFIVKTNDEARAAQILDRTIQQLLVELKCLARQYLPVNLTGSGHVEFLIDETHVQLRVQGFLKEELQLLNYFQMGSQIFSRMTAQIDRH